MKDVEEDCPQELPSYKIISLLDELLPRNSYQTFSTVGSRPEILRPQTDIDLVFIVKNEQKHSFLNNLSETCKTLADQYPLLTHSFFIGPIKDQYKALLHCLVYTSDEGSPEDNPREQLTKEYPGVLKNFCKSEKVIRGPSIASYLDETTFADEQGILDKKERDRKRIETCKEWSSITALCWEQDNKNWVLRPVERKLSDWERNYLSQYYMKAVKNF